MHHAPFSRARILDTVERVLIVLLFAWLVNRFVGTLAVHPANGLFLVSEGVIAAMVLLRRPTEEISLRPIDWLIGLAGTALPMLMTPSEGGWPGGVVLVGLGFVISLGAKFSLRRSFGIVAANRGVKRSGLYSAVRHPMYLGYVVGYVGALMMNPAPWNAVILAFWLAFEIARIHAEERILMRDDAYRAHALKVRFRLIPGVY